MSSQLIELVQRPEDALIYADEAAIAFDVTPRTVRRMIGRRELPPSMRVAGRAAWRAGTFRSWIRDRAETLARDARRRKPRL